ncbi:FadR family transcriptional regulator [Sphingomonas psychrotolerans]|uniref:FadR family transcriptional regulator n=1 Tax=Sphingomonas psychrotolerans TaxID=1327635 RepID=A0ABU3MZ03_9SPHN|nr:FadR/GntR family transcriptional regulator [Sphingomonas psychrotolerans]MDT8757251.1 FadR family transcriptional regulator [Sphingomonas psychrotolerans]
MGQTGVDADQDGRPTQRKRRPSLVDAACEHIRTSILSGTYAPGAQLPTEAEFADVLAVSRTVIREAVARLAAEGLVAPRQGKGLFVSETARYQAFQITRDEVENLSDVIQLLELRLCVETEMAALAAERRSELDVMSMRQQLKILSEAAVGLEESVKADVEFHSVIARASKNAYYAKLIDFLGVRLVPPRSLYLRQGQAYADATYKAVISAEHEAILEAIIRRDPERARIAARTHMSGSLKRHRELHDFMSANSPSG